MTPILHNYSKKAGKSYAWDTSDSKEAYENNLRNPEARKRLEELGFIDRTIDYQFNSHGFRTAEFDQQFEVVCFGCSFTMGTGVHAQETWPSQLATITGLRVANLGHAGSSNDTTFRFALHYLPWLMPKYAIWLQTDKHRIELIDEANNVVINTISTDSNNPCCNDYFIKAWFSTTANQQLNLEKNTLAFQQLCRQYNIRSIVLDRDQVPNIWPFPKNNARDLRHPGAVDYHTLAVKLATLLTDSDPSLRIRRESK